MNPFRATVATLLAIGLAPLRFSGFPRVKTWGGGILLLLLITITGCEPKEEVFSDYGHRSGYTQTSLNGTRTLGQLFHRAGHSVRSWQYLSPSLDEADVLVWAPDDFEPPSLEVQNWLVRWLTDVRPAKQPRVLVYIGRDFDAAPDYWKRMQVQPPVGLKKEYARRLSEAQIKAARNRPGKLQKTECEAWFDFDPSATQSTTVQGLIGPWARGIDASKAEIVWQTRLTPDAESANLLLADENGLPLVSEITYETLGSLQDDADRGRVILVENGSFLLNSPLVNHEHRKLAGKLVAHVGPASKRVVFLESGEGGLEIRGSDPSREPPTGLSLFRVWPIGAALTQLAALGIVFALMKWPLFGLPRPLPRRATTDFGSHIAALGRLLCDTKDRDHAIRLIHLYRRSLARDTVVSSPSPAPTDLPPFATPPLENPPLENPPLETPERSP